MADKIASLDLALYRRTQDHDGTRVLQERLVELGYQIEADGEFGAETFNAVKDFQAKHQLEADGIVGPITASMLDNPTVHPEPIPDPGPTPGPRPTWPRQRDCMTYYGTPGSNQTMLVFPYRMLLADTGAVIQRCSCHVKVHDAVLRVFQKVKDHYSAEDIHRLGLDMFDGSLNVRKMRGGNSWSMHSWGIAFDFDAEHNQMKMNHREARFARPEYEGWFDAWYSEGAISLGKERDFDWMHTQFARL